MNRRLFVAIGLAVLVGVLCGSSRADTPLLRVVVEAGDVERVDTPVLMPVPPFWAQTLHGQPFHLEEVVSVGRVPVSAQILPGDKPQMCWILTGRTKPGDSRTYEVYVGAPPATPAVQVTADDKALVVAVGDNKVLQYNHATVPPPPGHSALFNRSAFIHPVWSPAGAVLTNIHPPDHIHHMGLWMPWTSTEFEGRHVDFWNLGSGQGTVRFRELLGRESGPVFGSFRVRHEHVDLKAPGGEKVALDETWDVLVWNTGGADKGYYVWDFVSTQRCASSSPLHLPAYRYGGFGFRATSQWKQGQADYLTSEGKTRKDGHGTRARWCMAFGPTDKGDAGIVFMSHPKNHEHPEPMRLWPSGDIFFNFCPVQEKDWTLEPGRDYVFRYRLFVYNGTLNAERAERAWQDFANPPAVRVVREAN
ncbi:MAG TPA: hypothetical protein ENO19_01575 [Halothiobacillaceae bacterium]|nr:hypothetical protein [Halothiobacillaceae bacterium]